MAQKGYGWKVVASKGDKKDAVKYFKSEGYKVTNQDFEDFLAEEGMRLAEAFYERFENHLHNIGRTSTLDRKYEERNDE